MNKIKFEQSSDGLINPDYLKNNDNSKPQRVIKKDYSLVERDNQQILTEDGKQLLNEEEKKN